VTVTDDDQGSGLVTLLVHVVDSGLTKFFVVDQSAHATFRYDATGKALGRNDLANSRPRGVASNLAGDTYWVVDASHQVFVYDADGTPRGVWALSGLNQPQDITTDGTDIWIVDAAKDRVYHYEGAASRTSGAEEPSSSFALTADNRNPTGIVTDGTYLWITNDFKHKDSVFVYTMEGTPLGSWRLDSDNGDPSGITLNPGGGTDLWVVDRHDSLVYHYADATERRDGNRSQLLLGDPSQAGHHAELRRQVGR
jgi:hypothetical protein